MKKTKKYFIKGVVMVCVLSLFSSAVLWYQPTKKVNADEVSLYYYDIDTTGTTQINLYVYVRDISGDIVNNNFNLYIYRCDENINRFYSNSYTNQEITRDFAIDYDDWDGYRYTFNAVGFIEQPFIIQAQFNNLTFTYNDHPITTQFGALNPFIRDEIYNEAYQLGESYGYSSGYRVGYQVGTDEQIEYFTNYYTKPNEGYQTIYNKGYNDGENAQINFGFFTNIFNDIDAFFSIHIAPFLTIGELITAPLIIYFVWFIIKQFTGGN